MKTTARSPLRVRAALGSNAYEPVPAGVIWTGRLKVFRGSPDPAQPTRRGEDTKGSMHACQASSHLYPSRQSASFVHRWAQISPTRPVGMQSASVPQIDSPAAQLLLQ